MKSIRSDAEILAIKEACEIAAHVLQDLVDATLEGITTYDLDQIGKEKIAEYGAKVRVTTTVTARTFFPRTPAFQLMMKLSME